MNSKSTQSQGSSADEKAIRAIHYRMIEAWNRQFCVKLPERSKPALGAGV